jgi:hypothetical protein
VTLIISIFVLVTSGNSQATGGVDQQDLSAGSPAAGHEENIMVNQPYIYAGLIADSNSLNVCYGYFSCSLLNEGGDV